MTEDCTVSAVDGNTEISSPDELSNAVSEGEPELASEGSIDALKELDAKSELPDSSVEGGEGIVSLELKADPPGDPETASEGIEEACTSEAPVVDTPGDAYVTLKNGVENDASGTPEAS